MGSGEGHEGREPSSSTLELPRVARPGTPVEDILPRVPYDVYDYGEEIGRGGLGRVVRATDRRLDRPVAIKELLPDRAASARRFAREAFITARLEHPSIVPVHEAGKWPNGQPFYVMKLISGRSLADAIHSKRSLSERLELVPKITAVAEAIAYAHSKGIIHRDIKPANVVVGDFGETMVIDWGLAKLLDEPDPEGTGGTARGGRHSVGPVLGTPSYMPPEQARGQPVDERADVYSLGALLYCVLAGVAPYDRPPPGRGSSGESPVPYRSERRANEVLADVLRVPPAPLAQLVPHAPHDLVTIAEKAMARDPTARYLTAGEMAEDLVRFQTGQLVSARSYTTAALVRRWLRRHRAAVSVAAAALLLLLLGGAFAVGHVIHARDVAEARRNDLVLAQARAALERDPTATLAWLAQLPNDGDWGDAQVLAADAWTRGISRRVWRRHAARVWSVAVSRDGRLCASASGDGTVRIYELPGGAGVTLDGHHSEVNVVAFDPAGRRLASGGDGGRILIWSLAGAPRLERNLVGHISSVTGLAFSPDGRTLASIGYDRTVRLWDVASGQGRILGRQGGKGQNLAFAPDGSVVAALADGDPITLWPVAGGEPRTLGAAREGALALAFSPDGRLIAAEGPDDGAVTLWRLSGETAQILAGRGYHVMGVAFSRDGRRLAAAGDDKRVRVWDLASGTARGLAGHESVVTSVAFTPAGDIVSGSGDHTVRLWTVPPLDERVYRAREGRVVGVLYRPGGALVSAYRDGAIHEWEPEIRALAPARAPIVALAAGGPVIAAGLDDGTVRLLGAAPPQMSAGLARVVAVAVSSAGDQVAWTTVDGAVHQRRLARMIRGTTEPDGRGARGRRREGRQAAEAQEGSGLGRAGGADLPAPDSEVVAFAPRGDLLAWSSANEVHACSTAMCSHSRRTIDHHSAWVRVVAFAPDGARLASAGGEGTVHVWDRATGEVHVLRGHASSVVALAFSPGARYLASGSQDGDVRLWDLRSGLSQRLRGLTMTVTALAFSPSGLRLAAASADRTARVWELATGRSRLLLGHDERLTSLAFSPDGRRLATASRDGTVRVFAADPAAGVPTARRALRRWLASATNAVLRADGLLSSP